MLVGFFVDVFKRIRVTVINDGTNTFKDTKAWVCEGDLINEVITFFVIGQGFIKMGIKGYSAVSRNSVFC